MWNFLVVFGAGGSLAKSSLVRRLLKPASILLAIGVIIAGVIYAGIVFHALSERSSAPHVHTHSTH